MWCVSVWRAYTCRHTKSGWKRRRQQHMHASAPNESLPLARLAGWLPQIKANDCPCNINRSTKRCEIHSILWRPKAASRQFLSLSFSLYRIYNIIISFECACCRVWMVCVSRSMHVSGLPLYSYLSLSLCVLCRSCIMRSCSRLIVEMMVFMSLSSFQIRNVARYRKQ